MRKTYPRLIDLQNKKLPDSVVQRLNKLTPIEKRGDVFLKRDDLFIIAGVRGGKARTCWYLSQGAQGLITAGSRSSPQVNIVAQIAKHRNIPCRVHVPASAKEANEVESARLAGAEIAEHRPGYNSVIVRRAADDAKRTGWTLIPFGMECEQAVRETSGQVHNVPEETKRIIIPVGSGMSLAGVLYGLFERDLNIPIIGVCVGADPEKRLNKYAPQNWRNMARLIKSEFDYSCKAPVTNFKGVELDPIYEAKCLLYLQPGDLFWIVGRRNQS